MISKLNIVSAAIIATGFMASAYSAFASDRSSDPDAISVKVSIADLNMRSESGAQIALSRIHSAAGAICGDRPEPAFLSDNARYRSCMTIVVNQAVSSLHNPLVTALNGNFGQTGAEYASGR